VEYYHITFIILIGMDGSLLLMDTATIVFRRKRETLLCEEEGNDRKKFRSCRRDNLACNGSWSGLQSWNVNFVHCNSVANNI
jgi:hypothetical protein